MPISWEQSSYHRALAAVKGVCGGDFGFLATFLIVVIVASSLLLQVSIVLVSWLTHIFLQSTLLPDTLPVPNHWLTGLTRLLYCTFAAVQFLCPPPPLPPPPLPATHIHRSHCLNDSTTWKQHLTALSESRAWCAGPSAVCEDGGGYGGGGGHPGGKSLLPAHHWQADHASL